MPERVDHGPKRLVLTCSVHGHLHDCTVYCVHESDETIKSVQRAHGAKYGGACTEGVLHVALLDMEDAMWGEGNWIEHEGCPAAAEAGQDRAVHHKEYHRD